MSNSNSISGILLVHKNRGTTSFSLVKLLRKMTNVSKIGFSGTLDPLAEGLMVMLIGKNYTKRSSEFTNFEKEYVAKIFLGKETTTFDEEGDVLKTSSIIPTQDQIDQVLTLFQGEKLQIPPMFSAKKVDGKKLYTLARQGITIERAHKKVSMHISLISYSYPYLDIHVQCSSGTYVRSIADEIGKHLGCGAYLFSLLRKKVGFFDLKDSLKQDELCKDGFVIEPHLKAL